MRQHRANRNGLHRLTAMLGLALVLLLNVLAASPAAHAWFHPHENQPAACAGHDHSHSDAPLPDDSEHTCVVFHFAAGHALLERPSEIAGPGWFIVAPPRSVFERVVPGSSRFLRPPGCGPPEIGSTGT